MTTSPDDRVVAPPSSPAEGDGPEVPHAPARRARGSAPWSDRRFPVSVDLMFRVLGYATIALLLFGLIGDPEARWGSRWPPKDTARMQLRNVAQAVDVSRQRNRRLPASLDLLTQEDPNTKEPYLDKVPDDPWGVPYRYVVIDARRGRYTLRSAGPDGTFETDDDIVFPEPLARPE